MSFKEYGDRMKEGQQFISFSVGEGLAVASSSPFLEALRRKRIKVHYTVSPMREYAVQQLK